MLFAPLAAASGAVRTGPSLNWKAGRFLAKTIWFAWVAAERSDPAMSRQLTE